MFALVYNEYHNDCDVHLSHVEYAQTTSVQAPTGLAPNEVHIRRPQHLPFTLFSRLYGGAHQRFDHGQLANFDLAPERQQRAYGLVREPHALIVVRVISRNCTLSDVLLRTKYVAGG